MTVLKLKFLIPAMLLLLAGFQLTGCNSEREFRNTININQVAGKDSSRTGDIWITLSYPQRAGKRLYEHYCSGCHGLKGQGDGINAYALNPRPKNLKITIKQSTPDSLIFTIIKTGGSGLNRSRLMPSYRLTLTDDEISTIIDYLKTLGKE